MQGAWYSPEHDIHRIMIFDKYETLVYVLSQGRDVYLTMLVLHNYTSPPFREEKGRDATQNKETVCYFYCVYLMCYFYLSSLSAVFFTDIVTIRSNDWVGAGEGDWVDRWPVIHTSMGKCLKTLTVEAGIGGSNSSQWCKVYGKISSTYKTRSPCPFPRVTVCDIYMFEN